MSAQWVGQPKKTCFIITPIGPERSEIRRDTDRLIESVLGPVLDELGYDVVLPQEISESGTITTQIIEHLLSDTVAIANLTGLNPNVMYELAVRHSAALPVVMIADSKITPEAPFDISPQRVIFYENAIGEDTKLKDKVKKAILATEKPHKPDNPVYNAVERKVIIEATGTTDAQRAILERFDKFESRIESVFSRAAATNLPEPPSTVSRSYTLIVEGDATKVKEACMKLQASLGTGSHVVGYPTNANRHTISVIVGQSHQTVSPRSLRDVFAKAYGLKVTGMAQAITFNDAFSATTAGVSDSPPDTPKSET